MFLKLYIFLSSVVVIALKCTIFLIMVDLVLTKIGIFIEFSLFLYIFQYLNLFNRESDHISFESTYWLFVRQTNMNFWRLRYSQNGGPLGF